MSTKHKQKADLTKYLNPKVLNKISRLGLKARHVVEGFLAGLHKSPYHGFSVEFAEHREYVAGDDIKHLDWKVLAKSDRYYIKQYEEEMNFKAYILLDTSESMTYGSDSENPSKLEYGKYIAASLAYLIQAQQDAVGLYTFHKEIYKSVSPGTHHKKLLDMISLLENPVIGPDTKVGPVIQQLAANTGTRGIVIIISDLFNPPEDFKQGIAQLQAKKHEVIVFHLLDRYELTFPFDRMTRFEGLEEYPELLLDPRPLRKAYLAEMDKFTTDIRRICLKTKADYVLLDTDMMLDVALSAYLATRSSSRK